MNAYFEEHQGPRNVLIADDDPAVLRLLGTRCAMLGFHVDTATNGMQLLVKARHRHPDILIVDINMPALDGLSICTSLLEPGRKPVEVIVISGTPDHATPERCESLGVFFGRKGPDFWKNVECALAEICPDIVDRIAKLPAVPSTTLRQRPCVLVVDDDASSFAFLSSRLEKYGIDAIYASDATQACRVAGKQRPSVIISDNYMPDGDAKYLLCRLRGSPLTADIPVIVISGRKLSELDEQSLRREICGWPGAVQVLRKSFDTQELFGALEKFCSFKKPGAEAAPGSALGARAPGNPD